MSGVRFFEMNFADLNRRGATLEIDNNPTTVEYLVNRDPLWRYVSIGSNDATAVTLEIELDRPREINSVFLLDNNIKGFTLQRRNSVGVWSTVVTEAANTSANYFRAFTPVVATAVRLIMQTTMVVDAQKTMREFIITKDIGQLEGYPKLRFTYSAANQQKNMITGKKKFVLDDVTSELTLGFTNHVGDNDRALFTTLNELRDSFLVWPCGGNATQFGYNDVGYRLGDVYLMGIMGGYSHEFMKNLYQSGFTASVRLSEAA